MNGSTAVSLVVATLVWSSSNIVLAQANTGSRVTPDEAKELVKLHNQARAAVRVGPVEWSPELAAYAQQWADELALNGKFEHRPEDGEFAQKYGENIAFGFGTKASVEEAMRGFLSERKFYQPGTPIAADTYQKYGHYTAVVWKTVKHIGAGRALVQTGPLAGSVITVINYDPRTNALGEKPY